MPTPKPNGRLMELAKRGAHAQLNDLVHEINMLLELFPHLRDSFDKDELPLAFILKKGAARAAKRSTPVTATAPGPEKRQLTPAGRQAPSNAQKADRALKKATDGKKEK